MQRLTVTLASSLLLFTAGIGEAGSVEVPSTSLSAGTIAALPAEMAAVTSGSSFAASAAAYCWWCWYSPYADYYWCQEGNTIIGYEDCFGPMLPYLPCTLYGEWGPCQYSDEIEYALDGTALPSSNMTRVEARSFELAVRRKLERADLTNSRVKEFSACRVVYGRRYAVGMTAGLRAETANLVV